jgi:putative transposase
MRERGGSKLALSARAPMVKAQGPNQRWRLDFVSDSLFRLLSVIDGFSRECLAAGVDTSA